MVNPIIARIESSTKGKFYDIKWSNARQRLTCNCPDFEHRGSKEKDGVCKHITQALKEELIPIHLKQSASRYKPRQEFDEVARMIITNLNILGFQSHICGSYRRMASQIKDLDFIVYLESNIELQRLQKEVTCNCDEGVIDYGGDHRITAMFKGVQVDFRLYYDRDQNGSMLLHFTGSKANNIMLRKKAIDMDMKLSEYGLIIKDGTVIASKTEEDIYTALSIPFVEPSKR